MTKSPCSSCTSKTCSATQKRPDETDQEFQQRQLRQQRMCKIKHKVLVLSGKGGVGKSTVAVNMAAKLAKDGFKVGLVDADIHGPSIPKMLKLEEANIFAGSDNSILPVEFNKNLKVMSVGFFLETQDTAVIWRGPKKYSLIKQFLEEVEWGELDYLIFDLPPGTGDEALSICQLIENADGAVIVSTPQAVSVNDVRKSITFCRNLELPVLGVIENMSGFKCQKCGEVVHIFGQGGAEAMAKDMQVPFLGEIPIEPAVVKNGDSGVPTVFQEDNSELQLNFGRIADAINNQLKKDQCIRLKSLRHIHLDILN